MIDHLSILVKHYDRAKAFYTAALAPLGYGLLTELTRETHPELPVTRSCAFSDDDKPQLWLNEVLAVVPTHLAFVARTRAQVDAFHAAALAAGGVDHGAPGVRAAPYPPDYYAAFVRDPDGYNIEAVCRARS